MAAAAALVDVPVVSIVDTKNMRGEFSPDAESTAIGKACREDHLQLDHSLVAAYKHYLIRTSAAHHSDVPWIDALTAGDRTVPLELSVKPGPTDFQRRLRRRTLTFTAVVSGGQARPPFVSVVLPPEECTKLFFVGCSHCPTHAFVPLSIGLEGYRIHGGKDVNTSFSVQLETAWADFMPASVSAKQQQQQQQRKIKPRRWFGVESYEAVCDVSAGKTTVIGNGPQIGTASSSQEYRRRPRLLYSADERFVTPENIETIAALYAGTTLEDFGALPIDGRVDQMLLRKPSLHSRPNVAPSLLSLKYTADFARRFNGASPQTIEEHSRNAEGFQTRTKEDKFWLCETKMLHKVVNSVRTEFTERCLAMDFRDGITVTFRPDDAYGWRQPGAAAGAAAGAAGAGAGVGAAAAAAADALPAPAAAAGAGAGGCTLSATFVLAGIVA